jgi:hypothetical protein
MGDPSVWGCGVVHGRQVVGDDVIVVFSREVLNRLL